MAQQGSGGGVKTVLGIVVVALAVFIGYPMLTEGTGNACLALEKRVVGGAAVIDDGRAAETTAAKAYPGVPSILSCSYLYWQSLMGKSGGRSF